MFASRPRSGLTGRSVVATAIAALVAMLMLLSAAVGTASAHPGPSRDAPASGHSIIGQFGSPSASAKPMVRAWWPDAGAGASTEGRARLRDHVRDMAKGGFGGMEVAFLSDQLTGIPQSSTLPESQRLGQPGVDQSVAQTDARQCCLDFSNAEAKDVGFGTKNWQNVLTGIYDTANSLPGGFVVDLTLSQHWPVAFNNLDPNDFAQQQYARTAFSPITSDDVSAGVKDVPRPATRLWDLDNVPFVFVDHYAAATVMKVASVSADGTPTFSYGSLTDVSDGTTRKQGPDGKPSGSPAGIMDRAWVRDHPSGFTGNLTSGSTTVTGLSSTNGAQRQAGSLLSGPGIPDGTEVVSVSGDSLVMSKAATASTTGADIDARWNINTIDADWGPAPADRHFKGKIDAEGNRRRMADWQYEYQTAIDPQALDRLGCTIRAPGAKLAAGDCVLFGTWFAGTGQTRSGGANTVQHNREYVTSVYDRQGTQATIDFWENQILGTWKDGAVVKRLGDRRLLDLIRENARRFPQASLFEDSLEFSSPDRSASYWAPHVLDEMSSRLGYDAARYAPVLAGGSQFDATTADGLLPSERVVEDWTATLGDDFSTYHVAALQRWARSTLGYNFRVQDIGGTGIAHAQIPTGVHETSADSGAAENGRQVAGVAALTGDNWVSAESLTFTKDYTNPWVDDVKGLNLDWAAGINRPQWHGTPYDVTFNGANSGWPGWEFQHGSPTGWGAFAPRQTYWGHVHELTDYVARSQAVLQGGVPKADLAVMRGTNEFSSPSRSSYSLSTLMDAGWSYHVIDDRMVQLPHAVVRHGVLDPYGPTNGFADGPAYKAVVVSGVTELKVATVKKLTQYAREGLPIVFFDSHISRVYGTNQPGGESTSLNGNNDTALAAALATLMATRNVYSVESSSQDALIAQLESIGLAPNASYAAPGLITLQREDPGPRRQAHEYYYLYNSRTATTLSAAANAGDTAVRLASTASEAAGDEIVVGSGADREVATIASVPSPAPADPAPNVTLREPLRFAHASGETVSKRVHASVALRGSGEPRLLDAWTGDVVPVADYTSRRGTVTVEVTLDSQDAMLVETGEPRGGIHATGTDGGSVVREPGGQLALRATSPGDYRVSLSNGMSRTVHVRSVPNAPDLSGGWSLRLESWGPGGSATDPTVSAKTTVTFPDDPLGYWSALPATAEQLSTLGVTSMSQVSGIGYYRNTFRLPGDWNPRRDGANLAFGHGNGDMVTAVTVNGARIDTIDQVTDRVDAGRYLRPGTNTIEVELDTDLGNRVGRAPQNYGLTGVSFVPYTDLPIEGRGRHHGHHRTDRRHHRSDRGRLARR